MAKEESNLGITGTYCVLLTSPLFNSLNPTDDEMTSVTDAPVARSDGESTLETFPDSLHLLVHPERWNSNQADQERIVEDCVIDSCRYVNRRARAEFGDPFRRT